MFYTRFNPFKEPGLTTTQPTCTQDSFAPDCDLKTIIERYTQTGILPGSAVSKQIYDDFLDFKPDLVDAHLAMEDAMAEFNTIPSEIRAEFGNSPLALAEALQKGNLSAKVKEFFGMDKEKFTTPQTNISAPAVAEKVEIKEPPQAGTVA